MPFRAACSRSRCSTDAGKSNVIVIVVQVLHKNRRSVGLSKTSAWRTRQTEAFCAALDHPLFRRAAAYALSDAGGLVPLDGLHHVWYEGFSIG